MAIIESAAIIFTTIHAQDFRDDEGDKLLGRKTFTLAYPEFARITMPFTLIFWSLVLLMTSSTNVYVLYGMLTLALYTGLRFLTLQDAREDRHSYLLYNVSFNFLAFTLPIDRALQIWLCLAHVGLSGLQLETHNVAQMMMMMNSIRAQ
jgi:hypothetical protein